MLTDYQKELPRLFRCFLQVRIFEFFFALEDTERTDFRSDFVLLKAFILK